MKPAVVFIIAFVVATAASAGAKVALSKPTHPAGAPGDSSKAKDDSSKTKGDSTTTDTAAVAGGAPGTSQSDSAHAVAAAADTSHGPATALPIAASTQPAAITVPKQPTPGGVAQQGNASPRTAVAAAAVPDTSSERRVAKVFTSMDAKQAAKVLEHMADPDVQIILGYVGPRQAAAIMAALPPERVATLSKLAMQGGGKK